VPTIEMTIDPRQPALVEKNANIFGSLNDRTTGVAQMLQKHHKGKTSALESVGCH
jgi:hypothetical protein